jgi:uncharacterized protein YwgA
MLDRLTALGGVLKRIGCFDPSSFQSEFNDRLILQKIIYLMEESNLSLGYSYNWYLRGPYSPSLTRDAYELVKKFNSLPRTRFVDPEAEDRFAKFMTFVRPHARDHVWLEKIASIHFLIRTYPDKSRDQIFSETKKKVHSLTEQEFKDMCAQLKNVGLL